MIYRPDLRLAVVVGAALAFGGAASGATAADALAEAVAALDRADGIAAEVAAKRALAAGAARSEVAAVAGEAELLQGELTDARAWLGPRDFADTTRQRGFRALARLEMQERDLAAAAEAYDRALAAGSESAPLWVEIGRLRYLAGQHDLALAASAKAIDLDPDDPRALEFVGQITRDARGVRAALPWFERALERAPEDLALLGEYAATLGEAGRNREMLAVARRMVSLDPRHPRAYYLQAVLAARTGRDDLARRLMWRTDGAYDDTPAGIMLNGVLEMRMGAPALAVDRFDALVRMQPDNALAKRLLGRALLANGEANEVIARFASSADRPDAEPYLLALVGRAFEQLGRREEAARYLDRAAAPVPTAIGVLPFGEERGSEQPSGAAGDVLRLRQLLASDRHGEALALVGELRRRYQGSADVEVLAGDVAALTGDAASALAAYQRASAIRRDFALVTRMAHVQRRLGHHFDARQLLADYAIQNPRSAPAAAMLGRALASSGDWRGAAAWLDYARRIGGEGSPRLLTDLAEARLALGEADAARAAVSRAYALQRSDGRIAGVLARAMQESQAGGGGVDRLLAKARQLDAPPALAQR